MKYIMRMVYGNPDGCTAGTEYCIAESAEEMQRLRNVDAGYTSITCLAPVVDIPDWIKRKIQRDTDWQRVER